VLGKTRLVIGGTSFPRLLHVHGKSGRATHFTNQTTFFLRVTTASNQEQKENLGVYFFACLWLALHIFLELSQVCDFVVQVASGVIIIIIILLVACTLCLAASRCCFWASFNGGSCCCGGACGSGHVDRRSGVVGFLW